MNILHSKRADKPIRATKQKKRSEPFCCVIQKKTHRCSEESAHQIKPSTHSSVHATPDQLRGWVGVQKSIKKHKAPSSLT